VIFESRELSVVIVLDLVVTHARRVSLIHGGVVEEQYHVECFELLRLLKKLYVQLERVSEYSLFWVFSRTNLALHKL